MVDGAAPTGAQGPGGVGGGPRSGSWCAPWCPVGASIPGRPLDGKPEVVVDGVDHQPGPAQRGDPELGVGLGPQRVVDLGDDPVDAELLGRELGGHDVPVVAFGQGQEDVGALGAGPLEDVLVGAVATDRRAAERGRQPIEGGGGTVDDEHLDDPIWS